MFFLELYHLQPAGYFSSIRIMTNIFSFSLLVVGFSTETDCLSIKTKEIAYTTIKSVSEVDATSTMGKKFLAWCDSNRKPHWKAYYGYKEFPTAPARVKALGLLLKDLAHDKSVVLSDEKILEILGTTKEKKKTAKTLAPVVDVASPPQGKRKRGPPTDYPESTIPHQPKKHKGSPKTNPVASTNPVFVSLNDIPYTSLVLLQAAAKAMLKEKDEENQMLKNQVTEVQLQLVSLKAKVEGKDEMIKMLLEQIKEK